MSGRFFYATKAEVVQINMDSCKMMPRKRNLYP